MVYHDAESALVGAKIQEYLAKHDVRSITTLGHAAVAERTIRTIKGLLYPRVEKYGAKWWSELPRVPNVYNKVSKHRAIGMSPLLNGHGEEKPGRRATEPGAEPESRAQVPAYTGGRQSQGLHDKTARGEGGRTSLD